MSLAPGARLGPYEIAAAIGAGGMGEVYRARDRTLGRDVALKVLPDLFANDPERLSRFHREAQVLASLNHPHIAQIYGFEDAGATHALVMELVDGPTLADRIAQGPLPVADALPIARQIADAFEAAHELGIVHRDLKPANIKVKDDGTVKVLDFGLAKALDPVAGSTTSARNSPTMTSPATAIGTILGTAAYMSPEQARGKVVDRRADIWAYGVVLYEMLTGRRAYDGEDVSTTLAAVLTRDVEWTALPPATPARVRALIRDCLVRDPKQRLRDIGDARRVLDQVMSGAVDADGSPSPSQVTTPRQSAWRRTVLWSMAVSVVSIAGTAVWMSLRTPAAVRAPVTRSTMSFADYAGQVALSRDGTTLAYVLDDSERLHFMIRRMDQFDGQVVPGDPHGSYPVLSPSGDWLAFTVMENSRRTIEKIPMTGGSAVTVCEGDTYGATWGGDDTIVFSGDHGLMGVSAAGGPPQALTTVDTAHGELAHVNPQFLPGARQLLFTVLSKSPDSPQFAVLDLQQGHYRIVANGGLAGRYASSGYLTFVRGSTLFAVPFDLAHQVALGKEQPVIDDVAGDDYAFSDTGVLVYASAQPRLGTTFTIVDRNGVDQPLPGQVRRLWGSGRLSPDGRRLASTMTTGEETDVWVMDLARGMPTRLTFGGRAVREAYAPSGNVAWTPDGRRVLFIGTTDGTVGVYSVLADGSGQPDVMATVSQFGAVSGMTPDQNALVYEQVVDKRLRVMVAPVADGSARQPHTLRPGAGAGTGGEMTADISPDGHWVAITSDESGRDEVYVSPFPGPGPKTQVSDGGDGTRWAPNGHELFYWSTTGTPTLMSVAVQMTATTFSAGPPHGLFKRSFNRLNVTTWDVMPDGNHFLVEAVADPNRPVSVFAAVTNWFDEVRRLAPVGK